MKYLHPVAAVPNELINDSSMHFSTKKVAVALLLMAGRRNRKVQVTFAELAHQAHCSPATAQQAVSELIQGGYIIKKRCYRFDEGLNRLVYASNAYNWVRRIGGYTLVRREILDYELTAAAFANLLFIYRCAGREGRAYPSLRRIAGLLANCVGGSLDMAKSTVCRAMAVLRRLQAVVSRQCICRHKGLSCNSYYPTDMVVSDGRQSRQNKSNEFAMGGSPILSKHRIINKITGALTWEEEEKGVGQFGTLHKNPGWFDEGEDYWFDGVGVKVFSCGEQDLTA